MIYAIFTKSIKKYFSEKIERRNSTDRFCLMLLKVFLNNLGLLIQMSFSGDEKPSVRNTL